VHRGRFWVGSGARDGESLASLDVGGYLNRPRAKAIAGPAPAAGCDVDNTTTLVLGRLGPWGPAPPWAGLHARSVYDNIMPMLNALSEAGVRLGTGAGGAASGGLAAASGEPLQLLVLNSPADRGSFALFSIYLRFLGARVEALALDDGRCRAFSGKLIFGLGGRGFMSYRSHPHTVSARLFASLDWEFWLARHPPRCRGLLWGQLCLPAAELHSRLRGFALYRSGMYAWAGLPASALRAPGAALAQRRLRVMLIDRGRGAATGRRWPFALTELRALLLRALPPASVRVVDYASLSLKEQVRVTAWADVWVSLHGSNIVNRLFLRNGALAFVLYPSSTCYHQSDHVDRGVFWVPMLNFTLPLSDAPPAANFSCGVYGQPCCEATQPTTALRLATVVARTLIKHHSDLERGCTEQYCCAYAEDAAECAQVARTFRTAELAGE